jgi:Ca2+-binding EF-hand superfamily protein
MKYKLILTDKYLHKGVKRLFDLIKVDKSNWLPNEDLVQMIASIPISDYEDLLNTVINNDDFTFLEYSKILLSKDELNEKGIDNQDMIFMIFDDYFTLSKVEFKHLVLQLCDKLIDSNKLIRNEYQIDIMDTILLLEKRNQLINSLLDIQ